MCNALVCLAVWLCYSARTTTDKILAIIFPITFVAASFEHSVCNMYFIPIGLLIKATARLSSGPRRQDSRRLQPINLGQLLHRNLLPVTIGSIIGSGDGGAGLLVRVHPQGN